MAATGRHQFLITTAVHASAIDTTGIEVVPRGAPELKGITTNPDLYEVRRAGHGPERTIDPVCLMELDSAAAAARLTWLDTDLRFGSDECLRLFVAAPER